MNYICQVRIKSSLVQYCKHLGGVYLNQLERETINISFNHLLKKTIEDHLIRFEGSLEELEAKVVKDQPETPNTQLCSMGYPSMKIKGGIINKTDTSRSIYYLGKYSSELLAECIDCIYLTDLIQSWKAHKESFNTNSCYEPEKTKFIKGFFEKNEIILSGMEYQSEHKRLLRVLNKI